MPASARVYGLVTENDGMFAPQDTQEGERSQSGGMIDMEKTAGFVSVEGKGEHGLDNRGSIREQIEPRPARAGIRTYLLGGLGDEE